MEIKDLSKRALEIREKYADFEKRNKQKYWDSLALAQGFAGDVGNLLKIIMAKEGYRETENVDRKLKHELADCLYSILILSEKYGVNIEKEFLKTMDEIEKKI